MTFQLHFTVSVAAGVVPLDLRLCEIATRDTAKIAAKRQEDPLKCYLDRPTEMRMYGTAPGGVL